MNSLAMLTPMGFEAAAVAAAMPGATIVRTGIGRDRALRATTRASVRGAGALGIAGVCAAVEPGLKAGDVVVATEVTTDDGRVTPCPAAGPLVAALRRRGATAIPGRIRSLDHIAGRSERSGLAGDGTLAVDMESGWLAGAAHDRPVAVARVVVETAHRSLWDPRTMIAGARALGRLTTTARAIGEWADSVAPRRVVLAGPRSFCAGVERAIEIVEKALDRFGPPVYVRKQIVHNIHVVKDLERRGAVFVEEIEEVPADATVVFSAHGVSPQVKAEASRRELKVIDATCPLVNKVHAEARRFAADGHTIFLVGHEGHEEVEGTMGEAPAAMRLVENVEAARAVEVDDGESVSYLTQTTLSLDETNEIVDELRQRFPALQGPGSADICYATQNRQDALKAIMADSDVVLVVGSFNSSNSKRLVEVSERAGTPAYLIDDAMELDPAWLVGARTVGVTAGASAPDGLVWDVIDALDGLGGATVSERSVASESVIFHLPKEVG